MAETLTETLVDLCRHVVTGRPMGVTKRIRRRAVAIPLVGLPRMDFERCESVGIQPGMLGWVKLPRWEPVVVLAVEAEGVYFAPLADAEAAHAITFEHLRDESYKGRTAADVSALYRVPPEHMHTEGKKILRADFDKLRAALQAG